MMRVGARVLVLVLAAVLMTAGIFVHGGRALAAVGDITEYAIPTFPPSWPIGIAAGPDGNLWFVESVGNKVAKVTTSGVFTEYTIPTAQSYPSAITAGPDGNLWFTEGGKVAKVTTSGVITEYPIPSGNGPGGITAGPDGNLWFAEGDKVAKVTTSGVFTEYSIPTAGSEAGVAVGPDGNLWFTEGSKKVAKVTTSGALTEYAVPFRAHGITPGPDGNLWITSDDWNGGGSRVAKVTTSGTSTAYALPPVSGPTNIVAGPDGNLWFTERYRSNIAMLTTCGALTEYPVPDAPSGTGPGRIPAVPEGIAVGSDGNLWFTEYEHSNVAKLVPPPRAPALPADCFGGAQVALSVSSGSVGTPVTVTASRFPPNVTIALYVDSPPPYVASPTRLNDGGPQTDAQGSFRKEIEMPPAPGGSHSICADTGYPGSAEPYKSKACSQFVIVGAIALVANSGSPGDPLTITGTGFAPSERLQASIDGHLLSLTSYPWPLPDGNGAFQANITMQLDYTDSAGGSFAISAGAHALCIRGLTSTVESCAQFVIVGAPSLLASPTPPHTALPITSHVAHPTSLLPLALAGLVVLIGLAGGGVVWVRRSRQ